MVIQNYRDIKSRAGKTLSYTPWDVKKLVLVFGIVNLFISPLLMGADVLLMKSAENAQGLSGLGYASMLETVSSFLNVAHLVFSALWGPGIVYCGLMLLREQDPWPRGLLRGFKKWFGIVKYTILMIAFMIVLMLVISPIACMVALPFMGEFMELISQMPQTEQDAMAYMETVSQAQLYRMMMPALIAMFVAMLAVLLPLSYRVRMTQMVILDEERIGVLEAVRFSFKLTKGSCWQMFRLDLSFWWYYLLMLVVTLVPNAALMPVFADMDSTLVSLLLSVVSAILGLGVYMLGLMKVNTAEAVAYDHLRTVVQYDAFQLSEGTDHGI